MIRTAKQYQRHLGDVASATFHQASTTHTQSGAFLAVGQEIARDVLRDVIVEFEKESSGGEADLGATVVRFARTHGIDVFDRKDGS